jgi:hypothetical protein
MNFADMIAEYEAELVHRACQAEGFDAALTEKVQAWHARHSDQLDYAERRSDGVGYYVRCLGELVSRSAEPSGPPPPGTLAGSGPAGPGGTALRGPVGARIMGFPRRPTRSSRRTGAGAASYAAPAAGAAPASASASSAARRSGGKASQDARIRDSTARAQAVA